jgi:hypothetical protein
MFRSVENRRLHREPCGSDDSDNPHRVEFTMTESRRRGRNAELTRLEPTR